MERQPRPNRDDEDGDDRAESRYCSWAPTTTTTAADDDDSEEEEEEEEHAVAADACAAPRDGQGRLVGKTPPPLLELRPPGPTRASARLVLAVEIAAVACPAPERAAAGSGGGRGGGAAGRLASPLLFFGGGGASWADDGAGGRPPPRVSVEWQIRFDPAVWRLAGQSARRRTKNKERRGADLAGQAGGGDRDSPSSFFWAAPGVLRGVTQAAAFSRYPSQDGEAPGPWVAHLAHPVEAELVVRRAPPPLPAVAAAAARWADREADDEAIGSGGGGGGGGGGGSAGDDPDERWREWRRRAQADEWALQQRARRRAAEGGCFSSSGEGGGGGGNGGDDDDDDDGKDDNDNDNDNDDADNVESLGSLRETDEEDEEELARLFQRHALLELGDDGDDDDDDDDQGRRGEDEEEAQAPPPDPTTAAVASRDGWPVLLLHVRGSDDWGRCCTLGYGWLALNPASGHVPQPAARAALGGLDAPAPPGRSAAASAEQRVRTWRPSPATWLERQACLLVGGWPQVRDLGEVAGLEPLLRGPRAAAAAAQAPPPVAQPPPAPPPPARKRVGDEDVDADAAAGEAVAVDQAGPYQDVRWLPGAAALVCAGNTGRLDVMAAR